eukprot:6602756-Pyramimonas_sp.AAC.1
MTQASSKSMEQPGRNATWSRVHLYPGRVASVQQLGEHISLMWRAKFLWAASFLHHVCCQSSAT